GNHLSDCRQAILLPAPDRDGDYEQISIDDNVIFNSNAQGIVVLGSDSHSSIQFSISGNKINLDPYRLNANSVPSGVYRANGGPEAIYVQNNKGIVIENNQVMNACRAVSSSDFDSLIMRNNVIHADPVSLGF